MAAGVPTGVKLKASGVRTELDAAAAKLDTKRENSPNGTPADASQFRYFRPMSQGIGYSIAAAALGVEGLLAATYIQVLHQDRCRQEKIDPSARTCSWVSRHTIASKRMPWGVSGLVQIGQLK
jgi:hypothetical protein